MPKSKTYRYMKMARNFILRTTSGFTVRFMRDRDIRVPVQVIPDAIERGAVFSDGSAYVPASKELGPAPPAGFQREQEIFRALETIASRNNPDDFTGTGVPTLTAMRKVLEYDVDRKEVNASWKKYLQAQANADEEMREFGENTQDEDTPEPVE